MAKENMKMDKMQDKKLIKKAFGMHDKQEHKGKNTDLSSLKKGGGVKKMAIGGPTMGGGMGGGMGGMRGGMGGGMRGGPNTMQQPAAPAATFTPAAPVGGDLSSFYSQMQGTPAGSAQPAAPAIMQVPAPAGGKPMNGGLGQANPTTMKKGGSVASRGDGCAQRGKTKGRIV